jgi:hypothetical protein
MADEREQESPAQTTPLIVQSPNFRIIYANGFSYKPSVTDFGLTPLVQIPIARQNPDGTTTTTNAALQEVMIMLSLPSVKVLAGNLTLLVNEIEKEVGHIKVPRGLKIDAQQLRGVSESLKSSPLED